MSALVSDNNNAIAQCFRMPRTGQTTNITTLAAASVPSGQLAAGVYHIVSTVDVTICEGAVAAATDMPLKANSEIFFYVNANQNVSVYDAGAGGAVVSLTKMP